MTQAELIDKLAAGADTSKAHASAFLGVLAAIVQNALIRGDDVTLPGLCKIAIVRKEAHEARNPATGATVQVPAHNAAKFKALKALRDAIQ